MVVVGIPGVSFRNDRELRDIPSLYVSFRRVRNFPGVSHISQDVFSQNFIIAIPQTIKGSGNGTIVLN